MGTVYGSGDWAAPAPIAMLVNYLALDRTERTKVSFRFTALGDTGWTIDDVYVDPYMKG